MFDRMPDATMPQRDEKTENKAKVIPAAVVVNLVYGNAVAEETDDEGDNDDQSVPKTGPESGGFGKIHVIVGRAGDQKEG